MIQLNQIAMQYGDRELIKPVSLAIGEKECIGLVGKNGAGKSTLLKILSGAITPHEGRLSLPNDCTVGYLRQELPAQSGRTVRQEMMTSFEEIGAVRDHYQDLQRQIETREDYESDSYLELIDHFTRVQEKLLRMEPDQVEKQIELVLKGLGFVQSDFDKPVGTFSGGWRMRIELAKLLLQLPDLLLLDEPTNHLDIHSIIWLEDFLKNYPGSIILVSHDTTFMDRLASRIFEIEFGVIHDYRSGYRKFLELKKDRMEKTLAAYKNQQREIAQTKRNIERFRYKASKAKFAQTLIKKLDKMEVIEVETEDTSAMNFRFPEGKRAGNVVVKLDGVDKRFGDNEVLNGVRFELKRGEKVAFVGRNGMGKTTLARIIAGELEPSRGVVEPGHNVQMNYFAQMESGTLDTKLTVLETIEREATGEMRSQVRGLLGAFLFSGEDVEKKVSVLSGGERSRLALAKLLLSPSNFLLLDEPTNHLDITSKSILKQAIKQFNGAVIVVSHDRDFLDGLTDRVIEFRPRSLKEYLGDINYFLRVNEFDTIRDFELVDGKAKTADAKAAPKPGNKADHKARKEKAKKERALRKTVSRLESQIEQRESKKRELTDALQQAYDEEKAVKFHELEQELESLTADWMQAQEDLEALTGSTG